MAAILSRPQCVKCVQRPVANLILSQRLGGCIDENSYGDLPLIYVIVIITYQWGRNKIATIAQKIFSNAFSIKKKSFLIKMCEYR